MSGKAFSGVTIDAASSKDLDDSVEAMRTATGIDVTVCVADVASVVPRGHRLDVGAEKEGRPRLVGAYEKVQTIYRAGWNDPMLPRAVSERICSLLPLQRRNVMAIRVSLDAGNLAPLTTDVSFGPFSSRRRFSHPDVPAVLADPGHPFHAELSLLARLAEGLLERRRSAGALALYDLNSGWATDEEGILRRLGPDEANIGYVIVQELMVLANTALARWCAERELPVPFRNHTAKAHAPGRREVIEQVEAALSGNLTTLEAVRERVNLVMNRAEYGTELKGHYGLNLPAYVHATSPIRRYPDLVTQRQVRAHVTGQALPYSRDDVEAVARHVNEVVQARKDATHEFLRDRALSKAGRDAKKDGILAGLDEKEFDRVVKATARSGTAPPEPFVKAFLARLEEGKVSTLAKRIVLLEAAADETEAWRPLREAVAARLSLHPHDAVTVATMAEQSGLVGKLTCREARSGPDHSPTFTCSAVTTKGRLEYYSGMVAASSAKAARQRAVARLLAMLAGVVVAEASPDEASAGEFKERHDEPVAPKAPEASDNPISSLQEFCAATKAKPPEYEFASDGPSHAPTFVCTCKVGTTSRTAKAQSKKDAKRAAAALAVSALREAVGA